MTTEGVCESNPYIHCPPCPPPSTTRDMFWTHARSQNLTDDAIQVIARMCNLLTSEPVNDGPADDSLSVGQLIGITLGGIGGLAIIVLGLVGGWRVFM